MSTSDGILSFDKQKTFNQQLGLDISEQRKANFLIREQNEEMHFIKRPANAIVSSKSIFSHGVFLIKCSVESSLLRLQRRELMRHLSRAKRIEST